MTLDGIIEKNLPKLEKLFTTKSLQTIMNTRAEDIEKLNSGIGTLIRLHFLRPDRTLYKYMHSYGYADADEMTLVMLRRMQAFLRERNYLPPA